MNPAPVSAKNHFDRFLAEHYLWMAGGFEANAARNRQFFSRHSIQPRARGVAIDLGAGCGFQSVPLAGAGFRVTAVDFCPELLDEIHLRAPAADVGTIVGDLMDFPLWAGRQPELIVCMGDTLTHLPSCAAVRELLGQCHTELIAGGKLILSFRDYSVQPSDSVDVIPVQRDADRIFICRLEYHVEDVTVIDILFDRASGTWEKTASSYTKIRLAPVWIREMLEQAGFRIDHIGTENGMAALMAKKP